MLARTSKVIFKAMTFRLLPLGLNSLKGVIYRGDIGKYYKFY